MVGSVSPLGVVQSCGLSKRDEEGPARLLEKRFSLQEKTHEAAVLGARDQNESALKARQQGPAFSRQCKSKEGRRHSIESEGRDRAFVATNDCHKVYLQLSEDFCAVKVGSGLRRRAYCQRGCFAARLTSASDGFTN